jgi:hypothetical protein
MKTAFLFLQGRMIFRFEQQDTASARPKTRGKTGGGLCPAGIIE